MASILESGVSSSSSVKDEHGLEPADGVDGWLLSRVLAEDPAASGTDSSVSSWNVVSPRYTSA